MKLVLHLIGGIKKLLKKKPKNKHPVPHKIKWRKRMKQYKKLLVRTLTAWWNVDRKTEYIPLREIKVIEPNVASAIAKLYNEQEAAKKYKPKPKVGMTTHAMFRFQERFNTCWYSLDELKDDVTKGRKLIRAANNGNYLVRGKLWKYIISKDLYIVTMFPYRWQSWKKL